MIGTSQSDPQTGYAHFLTIQGQNCGINNSTQEYFDSCSLQRVINIEIYIIYIYYYYLLIYLAITHHLVGALQVDSLQRGYQNELILIWFCIPHGLRCREHCGPQFVDSHMQLHLATPFLVIVAPRQAGNEECPMMSKHFSYF